MFRFGDINILYVLIIIPVLITLYWYFRFRYQKSIEKYGNPELIGILTPAKSKGRELFKYILIVSSATLLIFALARPQFGSKLKEVKRKGVEVIIALDISNSMLAEDISPNRLGRAKQAINNLVGKMKDDQIGLIVFAGEAYTQLPITTDYVSAKMFLSNISPDMMSKQGTAIGEAIKLGMRSFTPSEESSKVIIIISDGENHEDDAIQAAKDAYDKGILVYCIGMGSGEGSLIPARGGGVLKDRSGNPVTTRMNPVMLNQIASTGGGKFYAASTNNVGLHKLYNDINSLDKTAIETQVFSEFDDQFGYLIAMALVLLIIELLVHNKRNKWLSNIKIFNE